MIRSRSDLMLYMEADRRALGVRTTHPILNTNNSMVWLTDPIFRWEKLLRICEYWENCHPRGWATPVKVLLRWRFARESARLGFSIPLNVFGPGLCILHYGSIVVSRHARIGAECTVNSCVNIGSHKGGAPSIGNRVYLGPGAKLFGKITIADNVKVGANAVVCKSCLEEGSVLLGVPAKVTLPKE